MAKSVDDLIAELPEAYQRNACWGAQLEGRAAAFIEGVRAREATGVTLKRVAIIDILQREFGVKIGQEALTRHLKRRCKCDD